MDENTAVNGMASQLHEEWRKNWEKNNGVGTPRMKGSENINVPFEQLSSQWQKDNLEAAKAAYDAVTQFPNDREKGAEYIHIKWLERNGSWAPENQKLPYEQLSEDEKDKDRLHYNMMMEKMNTLGGRRRRRSIKKRKSIKRKYRTRKNRKMRRSSK